MQDYNENNKSVKLLLYCTKDKYEHLYNFSYLHNGNTRFSVAIHNSGDFVADNYVNGKIVAECDCDFVEAFSTFWIKTKDILRIAKSSCLSVFELSEYQMDKEPSCSYLNGMHLSNVKVFDKPKELKEYYQPQNCSKNSFGYLVTEMYPITKAPQNMMYVYDKEGNKYILVSIHPIPLCKILNGAKTIEVRRKILKGLKELIK